MVNVQKWLSLITFIASNVALLSLSWWSFGQNCGTNIHFVCFPFSALCFHLCDLYSCRAVVMQRNLFFWGEFVFFMCFFFQGAFPTKLHCQLHSFRGVVAITKVGMEYDVPFLFINYLCCNFPVHFFESLFITQFVSYNLDFPVQLLIHFCYSSLGVVCIYGISASLCQKKILSQLFPISSPHNSTVVCLAVAVASFFFIQRAI